MAQGTRISGTFASGLIGAAIGGVIGAVLQSSADNFDRTQMARCALAGNLVGLFAGSVLTPTGN
jgi:tetrahydromethanopterin S-methyltransferase subunit D